MTATVNGFVADTIHFSNVDGPGNRYVVFLQGCNFDCIACHNPQTIPCATGDHFATRVETVMDGIRRAAPFVRGVTVSGGEATQQPEFLLELLTAVKADPSTAGLTTLVDSNGSCPPETWDRLAPVMDGAMIDLKCLDPDIHERMTGHPNEPVLTTIRHLQSIGRLHEVRLLLIDGVNDDHDLLARTAAWLAAVDRTMRIRLIGFRPHGARPHDPPLTEPAHDALCAAADLFHTIAPFRITVV